MQCILFTLTRCNYGHMQGLMGCRIDLLHWQIEWECWTWTQSYKHTHTLQCIHFAQSKHPEVVQEFAGASQWNMLNSQWRIDSLNLNNTEFQRVACVYSMSPITFACSREYGLDSISRRQQPFCWLVLFANCLKVCWILLKMIYPFLIESIWFVCVGSTLPETDHPNPWDSTPNVRGFPSSLALIRVGTI